MTNEKRIRAEYDKREKYVELDEGDEEFREHFNKWDYMNFEKTLGKSLNVPGQVFLYENLTSNEHIYYPKLSIFLNDRPFDQTIEYECFDFRRSWEWRTEVKLLDVYGKEFKTLVAEEQSEIQRHIQWSNYILVYGIWDSKPNWKEMRRAYEETWWFHKTKQEKRDTKLNDILNEYNK